MLMAQVTPRYALRPKPWYQRWWGIIIICCLTVILVVGSAFVFYTASIYWKVKTGQTTYQQLYADLAGDQNSPPVETFDAPDAPYLGNPEAKIVLVEFGDFSCPFCARSSPVIKQLANLYPKDLKIVYRHFTIINEGSILAANAAACAQEQGNFAFWALNDILYTNQDKFTADQMKTWAQELGLESGRFNTCLDSQRYQSRIRRDLAAGWRAGAKRTPTFFLNGQKIEGYQPLENWRPVIDQLIEIVKQYNL
ncbi:DsbA family protein [Candidatus Falkowbacteria bacterium]|nr:DsbA family protein [Candidatus Falkowbacteria bacterium]